MYQTHFLETGEQFGEEVQSFIENIVKIVHSDISECVGINECEIIFLINSKKVNSGENFQSFSGDKDSFYIISLSKINVNDPSVAENLKENLYKGLYLTERERKLDLQNDCGIFEEVIGEGLAEYFVCEFLKNKIRSRYTFLKEKDIKKYIEKMKNECTQKDINIGKWFSGNKDIPLFSGYAIGYYLVKKYLDEENARSLDVIHIPASKFI